MIFVDFEITEMDEDFVPTPSPKGNNWRPSKAEKHKEVRVLQFEIFCVIDICHI